MGEGLKQSFNNSYINKLWECTYSSNKVDWEYIPDVLLCHMPSENSVSVINSNDVMSRFRNAYGDPKAFERRQGFFLNLKYKDCYVAFIYNCYEVHIATGKLIKEEYTKFLLDTIIDYASCQLNNDQFELYSTFLKQIICKLNKEKESFKAFIDFVDKL